MWCVLRYERVEHSHEWVAGPWKAEVDVASADVLLRAPGEVDGEWSLTHGSFVQVLPLYDPAGFFEGLRKVATSQPEDNFRAAIEALLREELYEAVGKLRNAQWLGERNPLPLLTVDLARYGAVAIGLNARWLFTTSGRMLEEALAQSDRPNGVDALANLVLRGERSEPGRVYQAGEAFWAGVVTWAGHHGYRIVTEQPIPL
jgi:kanamycin nucleotidyltransferase